MVKRNIEAIYPLSPMQQGMIFHSIYSPNSGVYCEVLSCVIHGILNRTAFENAWREVIQRHAVLRTSFVWKRLDKMLQVVQKEVQVPLEFLDWSDEVGVDLPTRLEALIDQERAKGFDLARAPLIRLKLLRISPDIHWFVWVHHHAILDGWSMPIVFKDLISFYEGLDRGKSLTLSPVRPYRDYINWLQERNHDQAREFWQDYLSGFFEPTSLVIQNAHLLDDSTHNYLESEIRLSQTETASLYELIRSHQITLNTFLQGAWSILLSRYCGKKDVVFGSTVSGRPPELDDVEGMVGLFINTLPVRVKVDHGQKIVEWLKNIQTNSAMVRQFEYYPLYEIQELSKITKGTALFDSIIVFENYPIDASVSQLKTEMKIDQFRSYEQTNYPITVVSSPSDPFVVKISYDAQKIESDYIKNILMHLKNIILSIVNNPYAEIHSIKLFDQIEWDHIIYGLNKTDYLYQETPLVHLMIEKQARKRPGKVALLSPTEQWTYEELNGRANQLASFLRKSGADPEDRVGVCISRSPEMILALLAIMKAGLTYVPIDPKLPDERIAYIVQDAGMRLLITDSTIKNSFGWLHCRKIYLDKDWKLIQAESGDDATPVIRPDQMVYVIYTSGTTGKPKGVMVEHQSLFNLTNSQIKNYELTENDIVLQFISISFDAASEEIFPPLSVGATLYLPPADMELTADSFMEICKQQKISFLHLPTAIWHQLSQEITEKEIELNDELRLTVVGGEAPALDKIVSWFQATKRPNTARKFVFINSYGPTETTVTASQFIISDIKYLDRLTKKVPIGKPIDNVKIYLLDQELQPVPLGVPGEIFIAGMGLSRGYLNQEKLTDEKFIQNPFLPGSKMYRSGDIGRYLFDGNIEFWGRIDQQVKIRGYRVELEEIEYVISTLEEVKSVVVDLKESPSGKIIVAYLVFKDERKIDPGNLRDLLKTKLPEYMVPGAFIEIEKIPYLPTGKIDRQALPPPNLAATPTSPALPASTPIQEVLVNLWKKVLNIDYVSLTDNFFELGGHSLTATQLISRIRDVFDIEIPVNAIFDYPTIREQSSVIEKSIDSGLITSSPRIIPVPRNEDIPLSFSQQRLWFLDQLSPGNLFYNIPIALQLTGDLSLDGLNWSLNQIIKRHEVLRTSFKTKAGKPVQVIKEYQYEPIEIIDISNLDINQKEQAKEEILSKEAQTPFNLESGPLYRAKLIKCSENEHILNLTLHHIVTDGWSMGIMIKELVELYRKYPSEVQNEAILQSLPVQYADFACWQRKWLDGDVLDKQLDYWRGLLAESPKLLNLPADHPRPAIQSSNGNEVIFYLDEDLTQKANSVSRELGVTLFITLLSAYQLLFRRYTGSDEILVGTPVANRNRAEIENLIGYFINTLVMKGEFKENYTVREFLKKSRKTVIDAFMHQDLPFELLVDALNPQRDLSHSPIFQVAFTLQNTPSEILDLPGLQIKPIYISSHTSKYDITLVFNEKDGQLIGTLEYNTDLFELDTIHRMIGHYKTLLRGMVERLDDQVFFLPMLTESEQNTILVEWNKTGRETPVQFCAHQLFEKQVDKNPEQTALVYESDTLTYLDLDKKANQLAHYLIHSGVGIESVVGISAHRSMEMIIGILAVMKAGGAYLPLDPTYPLDRLAFMLEDSNLSVLLTQKQLDGKLPIYSGKVIWLDGDWEEINKEPSSRPEVKTNPSNLAYIIYTSGSTGKPKGTLLSHKGLSNLTEAQRLAFNIDQNSRILQFSPYSFDASVWEIFMALANGATLCLVPQETISSGPELEKAILRHKITNMTLPPSVLRVLSEEKLDSLKTVIAAGEACTPDLVSKWASRRDFFNAYGPTETTVCATMYLCNPNDHDSPPIGRPIPNTHVYILDPFQQPLPVGIPGELYVGGVSVARGYLNRPEITSEKFIMNPFNLGEKLYRTGDLVKYRADGNIDFLGRIDLQVKVRGFRIELGEIENTLSKHPSVKEAVVVVKDDASADKRIVAYITTQNGQTVQAADLKNYLRDTLPEYMVPSTIVFLDEFPLSPSGKIDRKKLPAPEFSRTSITSEYKPPESELEIRLCKICSELLNIDRVGVSDNFFELGGHSLLATQFLSRIRDEFNVEIPVRFLFENPTVEGIASQINQLKKEEESDAERLARLFARINELSDEEVRALLEEKKAQASRRKVNE